MAHGWYLTSSPAITVNWLAASGGNGPCRSVAVASVAFSGWVINGEAKIQAFYNVERPTGASDWQLQAELALLCPKK